jgi:hypothetical protein
LFVAALSQMQPEFPLLWDDIQEVVEHHLREAKRTREADRNDVLRALQEWELTGLLVEELIEETGLSERTVRGVRGVAGRRSTAGCSRLKSLRTSRTCISHLASPYGILIRFLFA